MMRECKIHKHSKMLEPVFQVVVLILVLSLCSVEGMRKRNKKRQQQGRRGDTIFDPDSDNINKL